MSIKFIEVTGKTEAEAIEKALKQLGLERDDISIEVLARAKTGFLGIGSSPAKLRIRYEVEDKPAPAPVVEEKPAPAPAPVVVEEKKPAPAPKAEKPAEQPAPVKAETPAPAVEEKPAPAPKAEKVEKADKPEKAEKTEKAGKPEKAEKTEKADKPAKRRNDRKKKAKAEKPAPAPAPVKEEKPVEKPVPAADPAPFVAVAEDDENAPRIAAFLTGLMEQLQVEATPAILTNGNGVYSVELVGKDLGALIGRRGETLDAIQQLTNYSVNRAQSGRIRIHIDAENYRAKREESLQRLAYKTAGKALKYRRNMMLEPMNAYERHVIHAALQEYDPAISTYSTGTEPNRRIVIAFDRNA